MDSSSGKRVTVLGGCGAVGSVAVKTLVHSGDFSRVVIADMNVERACQMAVACSSLLKGRNSSPSGRTGAGGADSSSMPIRQ